MTGNLCELGLEGKELVVFGGVVVGLLFCVEAIWIIKPCGVGGSWIAGLAIGAVGRRAVVMWLCGGVVVSKLCSQLVRC